jgi:beta-N-acetylhexosaminidase
VGLFNVPVPQLSRLKPARLPLSRLQLTKAGTGAVLAGLLIYAGCSPNPEVTSPGPQLRPVGPVTASATPTPEPRASQAGASAEEICVQQAFSELTGAQRAGQLVMTGVPAGDPAKYRSLVSKKRLGSVFLAGRTGDSPTTIKKGLGRLPGQRTRTTSIALLVSVDQEGGKVQALSGRSWTTIPSAKTQGTWSTAKLSSRTKVWVEQLRRAGVNMDLAPVADTVPAGTERENPPIGYFGRQYGNTPTAVSRGVGTVSSTMRAGRVIPTVKHFPGLGRVRYNTDTSTRAVDRTTTVTSDDLAPFQAGIDAGAGAVMISSASYPKIDKENLAVFSPPVITDLLRGRMKYQGVVMTDDVGQAVAVKSVPRGRRATQFIDAGGDLVLTVVPDHATTMVDAIVAEAKSDSGFRAKVNAATLRVLRLKQESGLLTCS